MSTATAPNEYLKRPYGRVVVPESDGTFRAEIMEFPGCLATGDTAAEALAALEATAAAWLEATIARGMRVPEPIGAESHSGKLVARLGRDLHRRATYLAAAQGISLNQFIVSSVAERVGMLAQPSVVYPQHAHALSTAFAPVGLVPSMPVGIPAQGRGPIEHDLKTWPEFFEPIWKREKLFELRVDDRGFQVGDTLLLREWSKAAGYSGRAVRADVTYLLGGRWPGLAPGYVVMSIDPREMSTDRRDMDAAAASKGDE